MNSLSDFTRILANYLVTVFHRHHSIDTDAPMARQSRLIGLALFLIFIGLPAIFILLMMNFPNEVDAILSAWFLKSDPEK